MGKLGDETESEDEGASQEHAASRPAGLAGSPRGAEKLRESEDGASPKRGRLVSGQDPSSSRTFAEVRALLWRSEWMKSQIELLSLQREQLSQSLSRAEGEKVPILLSPAPQKRKRTVEQGAAESCAASRGDSALGSGELAAGPGCATSAAPGAHVKGSEGSEDASEASVVAPTVNADDGHGCVRAVDWEVVLGGRRRKLVQASLPMEKVAKMQAESKKKLRAQSSINGFRDSGYFLGRDRPKTHKEVQAARAQAAAQQQTQVADVKGNVTNGGRKLVTTSGQKVIIKFSAKTAGMSPRTPTAAPVKNGRNCLTPRGSGSAETPISAHKKHRAFLGAGDKKAHGSPRMGPSLHTPSHTPRERDNHRQEWGLDEYVYGGPRTHTQIESVKAKDIAVPTWHIIEEDSDRKGSTDVEGVGGRQRRSLAVGSKYAKAKPAARANGHADAESSDELTDDEVYLGRHRPFEEQEVRFRHPKQQEREKNHKEALKQEGSMFNKAEDAYKSLWYRGADKIEKGEDGKEAKEAGDPQPAPAPS